MIRFNPFAKPLGELAADDLVCLDKVSEGWNVEYKESVPAPAAIAKSVSAFANHHGGWLFLGITGSKDGGNTAASYPGLPCQELPAIQERIRDSVAANISPPPRFQVRFLRGPAEQIGLPSDRAVAVIQVPLGRNAPFLHSSGRIYRRVADKSDPTHETDRHILDLLWRRGVESRELFNQLFGKGVQLSTEEDGVPIVTLHLLRDPLFEEDTATKLTYSAFRELMRGDRAEDGGTPFDSFQSTSEGFLARQVCGKDPQQLALTWHHRYDGTSTIYIPLRSGLTQDLDGAPLLDGYEYKEAFLAAAKDAGIKSGTWVDLNILMAIATSTVVRQSVLLREGGLAGEMRLLGRVQGVWRKIPFVDTQTYVATMASEGIPVLQTDEVAIPWNWGLDNALELEFEEQDGAGPPPAAIDTWVWLLRALGVYGLIDSEARIRELVDAQFRGVKVYSGRS